MDLKRSLLFFGLPGLAMFAGVAWLIPVMTRAGIPLIAAAFVAIWAPVVILFIILFRRFLETKSYNPDQIFKGYFNLKPLKGYAWLWVMGGFIIAQILEILLSPTSKLLAGIPFFQPPPILPEIFNPNFDISAGLTTLMGVPVKGNYWLILFWCLWLIVNIGGEELLWRGYALPRQKQVFGKWAWLINGLMWNLLIHLFMRWTFIALLPTTLILPYLSQKFDSTWPGIIIHGAGNLLFFALLIPAIIG
jgi:membrane protease YdiL (CAAX protease family)